MHLFFYATLDHVTYICLLLYILCSRWRSLKENKDQISTPIATYCAIKGIDYCFRSMLDPQPLCEETTTFYDKVCTS